MRGEGSTIREIADELGCSKTYVGKVVAKLKRLQAGGGEVVSLFGSSLPLTITLTTSRGDKTRKKRGRPSKRDKIGGDYFGGICTESQIEFILSFEKASANDRRSALAKRTWLEAFRAG